MIPLTIFVFYVPPLVMLPSGANLLIMASTNSFKGVQKEGDFKTQKGRSDYAHADNKDHG